MAIASNGFTIDLSGKVALVTGGSRGIGAACVRLLAAAGATVAINYYKSEEEARVLERELGPAGFAVQADMADPNSVQRMVATVLDRFGRLDILVNNAAIFAFNPFDGADYEAWQRGWASTFGVNVFGAANAAWLAMEAMRRQGGGTIVNIASRAAFRGETEFADYGASKAALVNLTISIARACARDGITATCVAPGFVETDMAAGEIASKGDELRAQVPLGRIATVDDIAPLVVFLASPHGTYLNGATIDVNGGSWFH